MRTAIIAVASLGIQVAAAETDDDGLSSVVRYRVTGLNEALPAARDDGRDEHALSSHVATGEPTPGYRK